MNDRPLTVELVLSPPETCPCFFFVFHGMTAPADKTLRELGLER